MWLGYVLLFRGVNVDKLERAIRRTVINQDEFNQGEDSNSINEISKMGTEKLLSNEELEQKKIVYQGSKQFELLHKFRDIRTAISSSDEDNVIMITSLEPKSGTSFFARNLAAVTSFDSSKTSLLIDCNIDKPSVNDVFELDGKKGVLDYVVDKSTTVESLVHYCGIKRYRCIPTGNLTGECEEYFTHPRFKELLTKLKRRYKDRNIFIDAPPILTSADTRILLEACDQVIVVVPYGKISKAKIISAEKVIPKEKFKGIVLNEFIR
jgi:Mrp family chromosome partitioning ATPase